MKNRILKIFSIIFVTLLLFGCDKFLDIVPDDMPSLKHAFASRAVAERFLFSCYAFLPDATNHLNYPGYFNGLDEFDYSIYYQYLFLNNPCGKIAYGGQNSDNPIQNFWSGGNGGKNLFQAIRQCNMFLEEIGRPNDISEAERAKWIAEVKTLKAYYHYFLMQLYGPIPIVKENLPLSAPPEDTWVYREPIDKCVDYIVQILDEAAPDLPLTINNYVEENGRITMPIALTLKAKTLALAASPLFNGNSDYMKWKDSRGLELIPSQYSHEKWVRAAEAIGEAIDVCHDAGLELYRYEKMSVANSTAMNDSLVTLMHVRKGLTDKWNLGVIWTYTRFTAAIQTSTLPKMKDYDAYRILTTNFAAFQMSELFYTNNGLPIDEDPEWDYENRYELRKSTLEANNHNYIPLSEETVKLHFDREPRFYATLGFDRGYFELAALTEDRGESFPIYLKTRKGEFGNIENPHAYYIKKLIAFESHANEEGFHVEHKYLLPIFRLADLYLLYSEALNEVKESPDSEVYYWINLVREVTGLDGIEKSWSKSIYPNRPKDKDEMRKIIQQERLIELAYEGQRFYDIRRWKLIEKYWTSPGYNWNNEGKTASEYYQRIQVREPKTVTIKDYLWPIKLYDLKVNRNLVQTWGW